MMQTTKTMTFYAYACIVRLQVFVYCVNTRFQRIMILLCKKIPGLSFVSDPRNVLRHKQRRLRMQNLGFHFAQCTMMAFYR